MDDGFLVDSFVGMYYSFDNQDGGYDFGHVVASNDVPISFSAGLKIGFLFKYKPIF